MIIDTQEETIVDLREKVLSLKKKQRSANQSWSHQSTKSLSRQSIENHTRCKSFTLFDNDHHKFFKFLNSFIFTDEDESTWNSWRIKMNDKLQTNVDHFNNENICIVYVISRLEDDCYDSSYASMLIAMLMTMLMTMFMTIVDRSSLDYRIVSKSILFRVSLCFSESYR